MTPEQLRASILQQAMEGKLVKQDPNDEPASVLLEKITEEKARLIKEKKIKRTKKLPSITDEEKPFDIPGSWEWVRLGQLASSVRYGFTDSAKGSGNARFIRITDIQHGSVNWNNVPFCNVPSEKLDDLRLLNNDILIARTGGTVGKSFIVHDVEQTSVFASYLIRIRMVNIQLTNFIAYFLQSPLYWKAISEKQSGTGQPNVNASKLSEIIIPLPSLEEQKRIVAKIEKLMPLVDEYAEAYDKLKKLDDGFNDKFKQSLLQYAMEGKLVKQDFNDISAINNLENARKELTTAMNNKKMRKEKYSYADTPSTYPKNWRAARLIELCKKKNGSIRRGPFGSAITKSMFVKKGTDTFKIYEQGNAINHTVQYGTYYMPNSEFSRLKSFEVHAGDIIISCAGTIGKTYILPDNMEKGIINQALMKLEIDESIIDKHFFLLAFKNVTKQLQENAKGSAIKNLASLKYLKNKVTFPLPPLAEQKRIVAKLDQLMSIMH